MTDQFEDGYRLRLRALEEAASRVRDLAGSRDADGVAIAAHAGLDAVYDLHEAYFAYHRLSGMPEQNAHLAEFGGEIVGALALARGAKTHRLMRMSRPGGFGVLPFGAGPFGGGWIWAEHTWSNPKLSVRAGWYERCVKWRMLWSPLDEANYWFFSNMPR